MAADLAEAGRYGIGYGWILDRQARRIWHDGRTGGFTSYIQISQTDNSYLVLLANRSVPGLERCAGKLLELLKDSGSLIVKPKSGQPFAYVMESLKMFIGLSLWVRVAFVSLVVWLACQWF